MNPFCGSSRSPGMRLSPSYKNLKLSNKRSPVEIKEKLRKSYREKVHNCRSRLRNSFRGVLVEDDFRSKLNEIYESMRDFHEDLATDEDGLLKEIREELIKEELDWWLEEYEKGLNENEDWNNIDTENVICPICQKSNFLSENGDIICSLCKIRIKTEKSLREIKTSIFSATERHNASCNSDVQFTVIPDVTRTHIYIICTTCSDMQIVI